MRLLEQKPRAVYRGEFPCACGEVIRWEQKVPAFVFPFDVYAERVAFARAVQDFIVEHVAAGHAP